MSWFVCDDFITTCHQLLEGGIVSTIGYPYFIYWYEGEFALDEILIVNEYELAEFKNRDNFYHLPSTWILA